MIPELAIPYNSFPISRILFDSVRLGDEPAKHEPDLSGSISKQCFQLPEDIRKNTRLAYKDGLVVLSLPLPLAKGNLFVAFSDEPPHKIKGVYLTKKGKGGALIDITTGALSIGPYTELARIYERVVRLMEDHGLTERSGKPKEKDETAE